MNVHDRVLLLRQTVKPVGFVAIGQISKPPREARHIRPERADKGSTSYIATIAWDYFRTEPLLVREDLPEPLRGMVQWAARGGGQLAGRKGSPRGLGLFIDQEMRQAVQRIGQEESAAEQIEADLSLAFP
jgi:hypothetical protein